MDAQRIHEHDKEGEVKCFHCLDSGYHFIGSDIDEDGEEVITAYRCRRCERGGLVESK